MSFPLNFFLPGRMQNRQLERLRLIRGNSLLEAGEEAEKEVGGILDIVLDSVCFCCAICIRLWVGCVCCDTDTSLRHPDSC